MPLDAGDDECFWGSALDARDWLGLPACLSNGNAMHCGLRANGGRRPAQNGGDRVERVAPRRKLAEFTYLRHRPESLSPPGGP